MLAGNLQGIVDRFVRSETPRRLARFCAVGVSGVGVNMGILVALKDGLGVPVALASLFAIELSILSNFALNNAWTWSDRRTASLGQRLLKYHTVACITALAANWFLLILLTDVFGIDYRISNLVGIAVGMVLNFWWNHAWTFGQGLVEEDLTSAERSPVGPSIATSQDEGPSRHTLAASLSPAQMLWVVIGAVAALTLAKLYFAVHAELLPEEAYYWTYLQHPALSYFDHPPMVAWIIAIGTFLFGNVELGVRLGTILLSLGSTFWMYRLTRLWFGPACANWAAVLFNLLPIFIGVGVFAFPDGPLVFFWLLTMYAASKGLGLGTSHEAPVKSATSATAHWLLAGAAFGGALLSKYTAVMLGTSLGLFLLFSSRHRHWLRRPQPWLAAGTALLIFTPVIIWNAHHEWASFLFQSTRTAGQKPHMVKNILEFWLLQIAILGPIPFVVFGIAVWRGIQRGWRRHDDAWNFALSFFAPLFLVFVLASFKTDVHINWTAPAYLSLVMASAAIFHDGLRNKLRASALRWRQTGWLVATCGCAAAGVTISTFVWGIPDFATNARLGGWRRLALSVAAEETNLVRVTGQNPFVIGADKYNIAAELSFYGQRPHNSVNDFILGKRGLGFRYWTELNSFESRPAIAVLPDVHERTLVKLREHFDRLDLPRRCEIPTVGTRSRTVWLLNCYGYHENTKQSGSAVLGTKIFPSELSVSQGEK